MSFMIKFRYFTNKNKSKKVNGKEDLKLPLLVQRY